MAKKEKGQKAQKPLYKKWWFWLIVLCLIGAVGGGLSGNDNSVETSEPSAGQAESQTTDSTQAPIETSEPDSAAPTPKAESESEPDAREALDDILGNTTFYENVRNDVTGKWRELVFYSAEDIMDHAVEYYNAYFSSDDEIHIAVNLGLKTTTIMNVSNGNMFISVHEYVDKEEHDAKAIGGGMLLKSYILNLETGEIEDVTAAE